MRSRVRCRMFGRYSVEFLLKRSKVYLIYRSMSLSDSRVKDVGKGWNPEWVVDLACHLTCAAWVKALDPDSVVATESRDSAEVAGLRLRDDWEEDMSWMVLLRDDLSLRASTR